MTTRIEPRGTPSPHLSGEPAPAAPEGAGPARPASGATGGATAAPAESSAASPGAGRLRAGYVARQASERVVTARQAAEAIARELPGAGAEVGAFAARYAASQYARMSKGELTALARFEFMRAALTGDPGLADRAIAMRTRGLPKPQREVVEREVARSGTQGMQRLAVAERAIRAVRGFSHEQQLDIAATVKMGASVGAAVKLERESLAAIEAEDAAAARAEATREGAAPLPAEGFDAAGRLHHFTGELERAKQRYMKMPRTSRDGEFVVGAVSAAGTVATMAAAMVEVAVTGDTKPLHRAADLAEHGVAALAGEYTARQEKADGLYRQAYADYEEYQAAAGEVERARQANDPGRLERAVGRAKDADAKLTATMARYDATVDAVHKHRGEYGAVAIDAAENAVLMTHGFAKKGAAEAIGGAKVIEHVWGETKVAVGRDAAHGLAE